MNANLKKVVLTLWLLLSFLWMTAQETPISIRGRVTEKGNGQPLPGVSVVELDKDGRTITAVSTDISGNYFIKVKSSQNRLSVSYIGYRSDVKPISGQQNIDFQLAVNVKELEGVEITGVQRRPPLDNGTGMMIRERDLTGAVARVDAKDLAELSSASIDQALQGRLPGVDFGATTGDPGAGMSIRIRGTASINGSADPLIVLDGMPYDVSIPDDFNFGSADETGYAQLLNITPADIKDITVLKDAASTAVWGARAANGVLIINTKRGNIGKPVITYNLRGAMYKQPKAIPMLTGDQFSMLIPEMVMNADGLPLNLQTNKEFLYDPNDPYWYYNYSKNTNWINEITQLGYSHDHNVSMTGGGSKARYYASVGYFGQQGTTKGTALNRINAKINLDYIVSQRLRFRTDITYATINQDLNFTNGLSSSDKIRSVAYTKMPNMAVYEYDIYGNQTPVFFSPAQNIQGRYPSTYNPLAMATEGFGKAVGQRITPHFNLQYDIIPRWLLLTSDLQFDINNTKLKSFLPQEATGRPFVENVVNMANDQDLDSYSIDSKINLLFTPQVGEKHNIQSLLSFQTSDQKNESQYTGVTNLASSVLQDPSIPGRTLNGMLSAPITQSRSMGLLFNTQYSFLDRYIVNAGVRMDGNSRFGPAHRYGYFPSLSGRWRLSGESFMQKFKFLDDLSIRASYGHSGNAPRANYMFYNQFTNYDWSYLGMAGVYPSSMALNNLKWETLVGSNLGFNLWMFQGRFRLDAEVYRNRTKDMIYNDLMLPTYSGYSSATFNVGTMDNEGWELSLNTQPLKTKNWILGFDFNIARNFNVVREVSEFFPRENSALIGQNGKYKTYLQIGNPFGSIYGFRYKGVYADQEATIAKDAQGNNIVGPNGQSIYMRFNYPLTDYVFQQGDARYEDINHDGNIDYKDMVYLGNTIPKYTGGFGFNATFKGTWRLQTFFTYRLDYEMINGGTMNTTNMYGFNNQSTAVLSRWRNPGDQTDMPRALYRTGYNWLGSDRYVEDASFVRLRSVTLRYNVPNTLLNQWGLKTAAFYITAENLYTWTKYTGQDPDVSVRGNLDPFKYAQDDNLTPPTKNFVLGLTVGF